jgi:O-acetyl-ADP-ribose deacetylase (regulator of RNase III)
MITEKSGDLLEANDYDVGCHVANCFCAFGSGIAYQIKKKFPEAYAADCITKRGDLSKLGSFTLAQVKNNNNRLIFIANMYAQYGFSSNPGEERVLNYSALKKCLMGVKDYFPNKIIGVPYKIGCGLAGGDYQEVLSILDEIFGDSGHLVIYRRPGD